MTTLEHSSEAVLRRSVLVVDDNDQVRLMLCMALETAGFTVLEAATHLEAQLHLARTRPDAVLVDLQRSVTHGLDLLTLVRARPSLHDVPIAFLAASDDERFRWQALKAGADWFGLRPLGMVELQTQLARLIRDGRPQDQLLTEPPTPIGRLKQTG